VSLYIFITTASYCSVFGVFAYLVVGTLHALLRRAPKFPKTNRHIFGTKRFK
jgi:hypothetical protein